MAPYLVVNGNTANAQDINQLTHILFAQSGDQEKGKYYLYSQAYANNASFSTYMQSESRNATPVSVTVDEADHAHNAAGGNCNSPTTQLLTSNGFHIYTNSTGAFTICQVGGNFTIQY